MHYIQVGLAMGHAWPGEQQGQLAAITEWPLGSGGSVSWDTQNTTQHTSVSPDQASTSPRQRTARAFKVWWTEGNHTRLAWLWIRTG